MQLLELGSEPMVCNLSTFQHQGGFQVRHVSLIDALQGQGPSSHRATIGGGVYDTLLLRESLHW